MPAIVPIVEGDGDVQAVPTLLYKLLHDKGAWDWTVAKPKRAGGLPNVRRRLSDFLRLAQLERDCGAILILLDLDDGCPLHEARQLVGAIHTCKPTCPVAVVFAHREYEAWFLASLQTLAGSFNLPTDLAYTGNVEAIRGAKEWLSDQMPKGIIYKETIDQLKMTRLIDLDLARQTSRSFRRLSNALDELLAGATQGAQGLVTPHNKA